MSELRPRTTVAVTMELRAYAEQVLFGTSLAEKLAPPPAIVTDESPGPAMVAPAQPGRPAELRFKPAGRETRAEFPGAKELEQERERGRLLHFFANHELLATELMALVLLRFPDAPAAFRRGVLRTLQDEQEHTRLYLERMRACGVAFGELPVSGYFWRCVAPMENPIDYVAGLSLTFEQANLDFARHFAQGFGAVGDADTAQLLERIYRDEIGHVAYGLKWFRRWKNPSESDWDAFCRTLRFPLSPQRAKGFAVNVTGRRAAGFDPEFIRQLEVFARSRGRTPAVFWFNPLAEAFIARGRTFTPTQRQRALAEDLAHLPMFLARRDDIVLAARRPDPEWLRTIDAAGFALPEFVESVTAIAGRKLAHLRPWAWSPDAVEQLRPLLPQLTSPVAGLVMEPGGPDGFPCGLAALFAKSWSCDFLRRWLGTRTEAWLCDADVVGTTVRTPESALQAVARIRLRGHHRVVLKQSLGLAGQNALRLWEPEILPAQLRWIERALANPATDELVVEPWLDRVVDFSIQAEMGERGLGLVGFTGLETDAAGRFRANWAAPDHARRPPLDPAAVPQELRRTLPDWPALFADLRAALGEELARVHYRGAVGVDAFVYRTADGTCRLKPVVEINPRYTMGRLTLELMRVVAPGRVGRFRLLNATDVKRGGWDDFQSCARELTARHPLQRAGVPVARLTEGVVILNDPARAQACLAVFEVTSSRKPRVPASREPCRQ